MFMCRTCAYRYQQGIFSYTQCAMHACRAFSVKLNGTKNAHALVLKKFFFEYHKACCERHVFFQLRSMRIVMWCAVRMYSLSRKFFRFCALLCDNPLLYIRALFFCFSLIRGFCMRMAKKQRKNCRAREDARFGTTHHERISYTRITYWI